MRDNSVTFWHESGTYGTEVSEDTFEYLRRDRGLSSKFYEKNHSLISKSLSKLESTEEKIMLLKAKLIEYLNSKVKFQQIPPERDKNGFNDIEIATDLLLEFIKMQMETYQEIYEAETPITKFSVQKLKWRGTPSQFGYLFSELAKHGFIEIPSTHAESSYGRYAKVSWELFQFEQKTTVGNLEKELNHRKNTLSDTVRNKFKIPDINEVSPKKKK